MQRNKDKSFCRCGGENGYSAVIGVLPRTGTLRYRYSVGEANKTIITIHHVTVVVV